MAVLRIAVLMAVAVATAWADRCSGKDQTMCQVAAVTTMQQCYWDTFDTCQKKSCSLATTKTQCKAWLSAIETKSCEWDDNKCVDASLVDLAEGLATFVIILIVISVLIVIAIIACIVCCCCMGAKAATSGRNETVVVQQPVYQPPPHEQAYNQM